jgi:sialic acid synthase SpsE
MHAKQLIDIGSHNVGGRKAFIIAEIGSNHCQDLQMAFDSIDAAKASGADAVKFQSINIKELYYNPSQQTIDLHKKIDLPEEWHYKLKEFCDKKDIIFFSTPTYLKAIDILEEIQVQLYKLASAQVGTFPQLVDKVARLQKPVILSTGLVSYSELERVVKIFFKANNPHFIILHCNSIYPTPFDKVNLGLMETYQKMFQCIVGFSDHTEGIYVPIAAVARGAKVIEKHFALDRNLPSPDAPLALQPSEFAEMTKGIRAVEKSISNNVRLDIFEEEMEFKKSIATRLVLKKDIKEGEILTHDDFVFLRHTSGVDCKDLRNVVNKRSTKPLKKGEVLEYSNFI